MITVLIFGITLLAGVYISCLAQRSILSTAVLFLLVGFICGEGLIGWIDLKPGNPILKVFSELALFSVLFTDGMSLQMKKLLSAWRLPLRALAFGLPLTLLGTAVLGRYVVGLSWTHALLIGAVLSPTDPVLVSAIVGREKVPVQLRHLLNVESGFNDGLALPFVVVLLAVISNASPHPASIVIEVFSGIIAGICLPLAAIALGRIPFFSAVPLYERFLPLSIAILVYTITDLTHANKFLAAFSAGITIASVSEDLKASFTEFGEYLTELLKLTALLLFGAMISIEIMQQTSWNEYLFMVLAIVLVRPVALAVALFGVGLPRRQWVAAAWFGPKGFASVVYSLLILNSDAPGSERLFHLAALVITASIFFHSSTDVPVSRWFEEETE